MSAAALLAVLAAAARLDEVQARVNTEPPLFVVHSYGGKCLDYGPPVHQPPGFPTGGGPQVYLNDCARTHPIRVEEVNRRHDVILHAGTKVLGITKSSETGLAAGLAANEFALELQDPGDPAGGPSRTDRVFALDGDSIILASSRPCINTDSGGMIVEGWVKLSDGPAGPSLCAPAPQQLVVQVHNARGGNDSPLVVAPRNLVDSEFWSFDAVDGSRTAPTTGFVRVATSTELWDAICRTAFDPNDEDPRCENTEISGWGRVITIEPAGSNSIDLSRYPAIYLPAGLTIRGDRRGIQMGPQISAVIKKNRNSFARCAACMFEVHGDYVRVTGLRLRGDSRATKLIEQDTIAIQVDYPGTIQPFGVRLPLGDSSTLTNFIAMIDRNDMSDWEEAAVSVQNGWLQDFSCVVRNDPQTLANVRVERNFLHDNQRWSGGYGVVVGRAVVVGNTFLRNRHAIAAGGEAHNEYRAWYNLVLSTVPTYYWVAGMGPQQDFDMHGTGNGGYGGNGGYRVDIAANTFLASDRRPNFELRGHPCAAAYFRSNVSLKDSGGAINRHKIGDPEVPIVTTGPAVPSSPVTVVPSIRNSDYQLVKILKLRNQFRDSSPGYSNPMIRSRSGGSSGKIDPANSPLRVGDFDGDGLSDLFVATGTAWYYSPGGQAEWRFLSAKTEGGTTLLFGDFDGDGRTDVFTQSGNNWKVSWAGLSDWETINHSQWRMSEFYIGDFIGDRRDDVFFARGDNWFVSDAGQGGFIPYAASSFRRADLAFGHFDSDRIYGNDEKTDVVGVVNDQWMVVYAQDPEHTWRPLRPGPAPTKTMKGLIVADFGGTGFSDIATISAMWDSEHHHVVAAKWAVSRFGRDDWKPLATIPVSTPFAAVGRFDETKRNDGNGADVLIWNEVQLSILVSGRGTARRHSRQDMA